METITPELSRGQQKQAPAGFSVNHLREGQFITDGLREFFEYRDLGIRRATKGRCVAHVIRARPGVSAQPHWHQHEADLQLVYVLRGWVKFEYEGVGEVLLEAGSCVHQPKAIRHIELGHSDDLELLEIVMPADFVTHEDEK